MKFTKVFYLETNQIWGMISTEEEFNQASNILKEVNIDILDSKAIIDFDKNKPNFGTRREHNGELTLREFLTS